MPPETVAPERTTGNEASLSLRRETRFTVLQAAPDSSVMD